MATKLSFETLTTTAITDVTKTLHEVKITKDDANVVITMHKISTGQDRETHVVTREDFTSPTITVVPNAADAFTDSRITAIPLKSNQFVKLIAHVDENKWSIKWGCL